MSATPLDRNKLLIVDDDPTIRRLFNAIISAELSQITVEMASNGAEAVDAFADKRHGVMVMDLSMPVMDGLTAFRTIETLCREKNWQMPSVIFCTGFAPPSGMEQIVGDGSYHFLLHKPVTGTQLLQEIQKHL